MRLTWFDCRWLCVALAVLTRAATASAQPAATSLQQLLHLGTEKRVTVTDANGRDVRGTIADVSQSRLCLRIGRESRCLDAVDIDSVRVRKEDSLANGALIGAAVGAGVTSLIFLDNECRDDPSCYAAVAFYGGIGAAAGLIIDALIHGSVVVYTAPSRKALLTVRPTGMMGVRLTLTF